MPEEEHKLTSQAVRELMQECLFRPGENHDVNTAVEGIVNRYKFHPQRLAAVKDQIADLLRELPNEFHAGGGGGWSFLNAAEDKHGHRWAGFHLHVESLVCLGIGVGLARWLTAKETWKDLPGGVPYVVLDLPPAKETRKDLPGGVPYVVLDLPPDKEVLI